MPWRVVYGGVLCFVLCGAGGAFGASIKVAPAEFTVHNVEPGRTYDIFEETGLRLTVFNDESVARTWSLYVSQPSERGARQAGYDAIPDPSWCQFHGDSVTVPAGGKAYAELTLTVPNEERYYNQHWLVALTVGGKPEGGGIGLEVDVRMQVETKSHPDVAATPAGSLGVKPSIVAFDQVRPGEVRTGQAILYNNTPEERTYILRPLLGDESLEPERYITFPYRAMPTDGWVSWPREMVVAPGATAVVPVQVQLPDNQSVQGQRWESIVSVTPDEGEMRFFRVQVNCPKHSKKKE